MNRCVLHFCLLLSASFVALAEREVSINLLHDLGDGFVSAGMIKGQLPDKIAHKQKLRIEWNVGPQAIAQLKKLAIEDRFYGLRIENKGASVLDGTAQFSVPARCFEASLQAAHRMDMHLSIYESLMGFQWRFHRNLDCSIENRQDMASWPTSSDVGLLTSQVSPEINIPMMDPKQEEKLQQIYQDVLYSSRGETPPSQVPGRKKPEKEKTFFEKHWMFIMAFAILAFNALFGKQPEPAAGPTRR